METEKCNCFFFSSFYLDYYLIFNTIMAKCEMQQIFILRVSIFKNYAITSKMYFILKFYTIFSYQKENNMNVVNI